MRLVKNQDKIERHTKATNPLFFQMTNFFVQS